MFGKNPQRTADNGDGNHLSVVAIFATIQGEGPRQGQAAVFLRLGGCNLACKFCDTEFEDFKTWELSAIIDEVEKQAGNIKLVVVTGGEPFRQPIEKLCDALITKGYIVQIETNGTMWRNIHKDVEIVCSPKIGTQVRKEVAERITAYKYLVSNYREKYMQMPEITHDKPIYVQPIDEYDAEKNADNLKKTVKLARDNGYNLSLQIHKLIGVE